METKTTIYLVDVHALPVDQRPAVRKLLGQYGYMIKDWPDSSPAVQAYFLYTEFSSEYLRSLSLPPGCTCTDVTRWDINALKKYGLTEV